MAEIFGIKEASKQISIDDQGHGEISFTVKNNSHRPIRARGEIRPLDSSQESWFAIKGEQERDFSLDQSHQFTVEVTIPPGTDPGDYNFRFDVIGVNNPDEDYSEGPAVSLTVPQPKPEAKPFPWWIVVVAAVAALFLGVLVTFFIMRGGEEVQPPEPPEAQPLPAPTLLSPADGAVFNNFPRRTRLVWAPVPDAASYTVSIEFDGGGWRPLGAPRTGIRSNSYTFDFVGAQPGRWRVAAVAADGTTGTLSPWRGFRYTR